MNITPLLILFIIVPLLAVALLALNVLLAVHHPDEAKVSAYECGLPPILGQTRSTFQVHFFVVALLFLIFDLEILLLFPIGVTLYQVSSFGFSIAIIFFIVLTIGFVLEIGSGAISLNNLDGLNLIKNKNKDKKSDPLNDETSNKDNTSNQSNNLSPQSSFAKKGIKWKISLIFGAIIYYFILKKLKNDLRK